MKILIVLLITTASLFAQTNLGNLNGSFGTFAERSNVSCPGRDLYFTTDAGTLFDKSICDGSKWVDFRGSLALADPVNSGWTLSDANKVTQSVRAGRPHFQFSPGGPGTDIQTAVQPFTTGTVTMCAQFLVSANPQAGGCTFALTGGGDYAGQVVTLGHGGPTGYLTSYHLSVASVPNGIFGAIPAVQYESGNSPFQCVTVTSTGTSIVALYSNDARSGEVFLSIDTPFTPAGFGPACNGGAGSFQDVTVLDVR